VGFGLLAALAVSGCVTQPGMASSSADFRPRIIVSTDIGGTDFDDYQSLVHLLVYADVFDIEGIVSSPYGPGRKEHILQVLDAYAQDYPNLRSHSADYPARTHCGRFPSRARLIPPVWWDSANPRKVRNGS
jgi:hypothetical protein